MLSAKPKECEGIAKFLRENEKQFRNYELRSAKLQCIISLPSDFLFRSGEDRIQRRAFRNLVPLFRAIKQLPEHTGDLITVEGHTDNIPIRTRKFKSNWELSSARATNFATFLVKRMKFDGDLVSVNAFAEFRPKVSYLDISGKPLRGRELSSARKKNRRVEIILSERPKSLESYKLLFGGK